MEKTPEISDQTHPLPAPEEAVGNAYADADLQRAQDLSWQALMTVAEQVRPGWTEAQTKLILSETLKTMGAEKIWHPPQIRFGENTTLPFGKTSNPDVVLQENDVFFLDIGPVFHGYEGDVGQTFALGSDPELIRLSQDSKVIFGIVKDHWLKTGVTGQGLYRFAQSQAEDRGWNLSLEGASGHRVSEFPHAVHYRGKLKGFDRVPTPNRWILEIHLFHQTKKVGSFFEDLL